MLNMNPQLSVKKVNINKKKLILFYKKKKKKR